MYLMRLGAFGVERPVARIDDDTYIDLSDVVTDFDESFFGSGGVDRIRPIVAARSASGQVSTFDGERIGAPIARPAPDPVHRLELQRPRRRDRPGRTR